MAGNLNSKTVAVLANTLNLRKFAWCYSSIKKVMEIIQCLLVLLLVGLLGSHELLVIVTLHSDTISITQFPNVSTFGGRVLFDVLQILDPHVQIAFIFLDEDTVQTSGDVALIDLAVAEVAGQRHAVAE